MSHGGLQLFDYQEAILDKLRQGFIDGHRCQVLVAPTGAGKTEMAMELLEAAANKGNRAAMLLDRIVLCNQTSERLDRYGIDHGVLQAGHWRWRPEKLIQVCSAQTLEKRGSMPGMRVLIVDECHQTRAQTVEFIKNNPHVMVVGLTATPFTQGLGRIYTNVVSSITTQELVERGRLAPLRVFIAKQVDMTDAKTVAGEWTAAEAEERGIRITGDVVAEWVKKTGEIFGGPRKTVVFASGVAHAADLAEKFQAAGYNFVALSYKDDDEFKADAIKEFAKPDSSIHGLIATDILTKGFDVPDVMVGISARPFKKSLSSHIQQMGRVMRCAPGKEFAMWLCMARGSRVLTDRGLVPIEKVSKSDKIWDGTNFVSHGGAVCNGIQKVITYQGLTATPGHLVHTAQGWRTFGDCAREQIAITQTGLGGQAIRLCEDHQPGRSVARGKVAPVHSRGLRVRDLWLSLRHLAVELGRPTHQGVQGLQSARAGVPAVVVCAGAGNASAMPQPQRRELPTLWGTWSRVQVRGSESCNSLDHGEPWNSAQPRGHAIGSGEPGGALRAGEYSLALRGAQPVEQERQSGSRPDAQIPLRAPGNLLLGQHAEAVVLERDDGCTGHREIPSALIETEREVWDILDAGPRNRFTCEGLLVHNCHSGNYLRFAEDWEDVYANGVTELDDGREKAKPEKTTKEKEAAKCPACDFLWPVNSDTCPCCGHVRVRHNNVIEITGELEEISAGTSEKFTREMKQDWYSQLLSMASDRGYSHGWVAHKYREKFNVWPKGMEHVAAPVSMEVARWVKSRQIAWAKSRSRAAA